MTEKKIYASCGFEFEGEGNICDWCIEDVEESESLG